MSNVAADQRPEPIGLRTRLVEQLQSLWDRVRNGEVGSLPVIVGLIIISVVFQTLNPVFLSSQNLVNLMLDSAAVGTIAIGVVLVLLVAQIDLSVGSVSGFAAAIFAVTVVQAGWPLVLGLTLPVVAAAVIGLAYGLLFLRFGVPSFVSTLGGLLAVLGFQLYLLGSNGTINIPFDSFLVRFGQTMFLPAVASYALVGIIVVSYVAFGLISRRRRMRENVSAPSKTGIYIRGVVVLLTFGAATWYLNLSRGVPVMSLFFFSLVAIAAYALKRTRWGRAMYATGGNPEAARRAGIRVDLVFLSAFILCAAFAAIGGLLAAGRLAAATLGSGTGEVNLNAIAAAVIGGTSLFGGRGSAQSALLGILVISGISNGLNLLNLDSSIRFMVTGGVLIVAVVVDSLARRSRTAHGMA